MNSFLLVPFSYFLRVSFQNSFLKNYVQKLEISYNPFRIILLGYIFHEKETNLLIGDKN